MGLRDFFTRKGPNLNIFTSGGGRLGGNNKKSLKSLSNAEILYYFNEVPSLNTSIEQLASDISQIGFSLLKKGVENDEEEKYTSDDRITELFFGDSCDNDTYNNFSRTFNTSMLFFDEAFIITTEKNGVITSISSHFANVFTSELDKDCYIGKFIIGDKNKGGKIFMRDTEILIKPRRYVLVENNGVVPNDGKESVYLYHCKIDAPAGLESKARGYSRLNKLNTLLDTYTVIVEGAKSMLEKAKSMRGIITVKGVLKDGTEVALTEDQFDVFKTKVEEKQSGINNYDYAFFNGSVNFVDLGFKIADYNFEPHLLDKDAKIYNHFKIPLALIQGDKSSFGGNKLTASNDIYCGEVLKYKNLELTFLDKIFRNDKEFLQQNYKFDIKTETFKYFSEQAFVEAKKMYEMKGVFTVDEIRKKSGYSQLTEEQKAEMVSDFIRHSYPNINENEDEETE